MSREEFHSQFEKNKRRGIKPKKLIEVGDYENGKVYYPDKVVSDVLIWDDYYLKGFKLKTEYDSILSEGKKKFTMGFYSCTDADTLEEIIIIDISEEILFADYKKVRKINGKQVESLKSPNVNKEPRKIITPHRKTLDNYNLEITIFQRDNYIGVPICLSNTDKTDIEETWIYIYNTTLKGKEGLFIEIDDNNHFCINAKEIHPI